MSIFIELTEEFNQDGLRTIISSGQAVVLHRLAMMSRDGDWIVRENQAALDHILLVLERHGARYRFGAPLEARWLAGGWSAHLEFRDPKGLRVRTDFFSRPPRLSAPDLARLWEEQEGREIPFLNLRDLVLVKMTQREKDYPIIGELSRRLPDPESQLLFSRSARDLLHLAAAHPDLTTRLTEQRPLLALASGGEEEPLGAALDAERRRLIRADEQRLEGYATAAAAWAAAWPSLFPRLSGLPLRAAHRTMCEAAQTQLPFQP
ncbi:MAG: hypothetical protein ABI946_01420 [Chthoniobacterales bacterium]